MHPAVNLFDVTDDALLLEFAATSSASSHCAAYHIPGATELAYRVGPRTSGPDGNDSGADDAAGGAGETTCAVSMR
jgi:hypothetical protein